MIRKREFGGHALNKTEIDRTSQPSHFTFNMTEYPRYYKVK